VDVEIRVQSNMVFKTIVVVWLGIALDGNRGLHRSYPVGDFQRIANAEQSKITLNDTVAWALLWTLF
jgi:hypothetical protein